MATWIWNASNLTTTNGLCFASDSTNVNIIVGTNSDIQYSSNQGVSWTPSASVTGNTIAVASTSDGSMMFAVTGTLGGAGNAIYNSTDYGVTWTLLTSPPTNTNITSICCDGNANTTVSIFITVGSNPAGAGTIYQAQIISGTLGIWSTGVIGLTPISGIDFKGIACTSNGSDYLAVAAGGTIYQSGPFSAPNAWTSTGVTTAAWSSIACNGDNNTFIACSSDTDGLIYTGTYSGTWNFTLKYTAIGISLYYAAIGTTGTKLYATFPGGYLYSLDSGSTWTSDTSITGVYSLGTRRPSVPGPTSGLPLVLGVNSGTNPTGVYYATDPPIPPICFKEGSKILCFVDGKEEYLPVETLKPGTFVKTYLHGYKAIDMIGHSKLYNPAHTLRGKNRLYVCKKTNYPEITEDLVITGCHSILVDSVTEKQYKDIEEFGGRIYVTDKLCRFPACLDDRAEPYTETGVHTIWHFALVNKDYYMNYGVYANGLLVESTSQRMMKDLSGMELV